VKRRRLREESESDSNNVSLAPAVPAGSEYASLPRSTASEPAVEAPLVYAQLVKGPAPPQQDEYDEFSLRPSGGQTTMSEIPFATATSNN
jgi:hypothetical protein